MSAKHERDAEGAEGADAEEAAKRQKTVEAEEVVPQAPPGEVVVPQAPPGPPPPPPGTETPTIGPAGPEPSATASLPSVHFPEGDTTTELTVRVVVDANQVGSLLGKAGAGINKIREDSQSTVKVFDAIPNAISRIVAVTGTVQTVASGLHLISAALSKEESGENSITLLAPNTQVGNLIGKGGEKIKETRLSSGARIKISDQVLEGGLDKSVEIKGSSQQVLQAVILICFGLLEDPNRTLNTGAYKPRTTPTPAAYAQPPMDPYAAQMAAMYGGQMPGMPQAGVAGYGAYGMQQQQQQWNPAMYGMPAAPGYPNPMAMGSAPIEIPIPDNMIGYIIGKGGSEVSQIRAMSGAQVKISARDPTNPGRTVTITGNGQQQGVAVQLVNDALQRAQMAESMRVPRGY